MGATQRSRRCRISKAVAPTGPREVGLEWGLTRVNSAGACPAATTLAIDGFSVAVTCASSTYTEAGASPTLFQLQAIALGAWER